MRVTLTNPVAGAGRYAWAGWANAFQALGHEVVPLSDATDLLINSTSLPSDEILEWRERNPEKKVALNVLAWTDEDLPGINNAGVQATPNNVQYAHDLKANLVFAQYSPLWREILLRKWAREGFKLGSMEMAADSTVYEYTEPDEFEHDIVYCGGYWAYKSRNIDQYLMPCLMRYRTTTYLVGKGWHIPTDPDCGERVLAQKWGAAKVCPNVHEPHSTDGGYDVVERVFKTIFCGGLCVTDPVEEIESGFGLEHGTHLLIAEDQADYLALVEDAIINPEKYEQVRREGQQYVAQNHTYINRVETLLTDLGVK